MIELVVLSCYGASVLCLWHGWKKQRIELVAIGQILAQLGFIVALGMYLVQSTY